MNFKSHLKYAASFLIGLAVMYGAWTVTGYVQEAEAAKDTVELAKNQSAVLEQEVEKAQAETAKAHMEIERLKAQALASNVFLK